MRSLYSFLVKHSRGLAFRAQARDLLFKHVVYRLASGTETYQHPDGTAYSMAKLALLRNSVCWTELDGYFSQRHLQPGDVVVDGGAYLGMFTLYAAQKVGPAGHVYAYEPDPAICARLRQNVQLNGLGNVTVINAGLWSHAAKLKFESCGNGSHITEGLYQNDTRDWQTAIKVVSLDDEAQRLGWTRLDFVKMDVEGAELQALQGCERIIGNFTPAFAIASYHMIGEDNTAQRVEDHLARLGYVCSTGNPKHLTTYGVPAHAEVAGSVA